MTTALGSSFAAPSAAWPLENRAALPPAALRALASADLPALPTVERQLATDCGAVTSSTSMPSAVNLREVRGGVR